MSTPDISFYYELSLNVVLVEEDNQGHNVLKTEENEFFFFFLKEAPPPESYSSPPPPPTLTESITKKHSNLILADTLHIARTEFRTLDQNKKNFYPFLIYESALRKLETADLCC